MNEPSATPAPVPVESTPDTPNVPSPGWISVSFRYFGRSLRAAIARPFTLLFCLLLIGFFAFGAWQAGRHIWAWREYRAGRTALERHHPMEAIEHFDTCLRIWPNDPDALVLAARAARRLDAFDKAEELLNRAQGMKLKYDPATERLMLRAARGELDQVEKICQARVEQNDPDSSLILEALVSGAIQASRLRYADNLLQRWLELEPENGMAHYYKGLVFEYMAVRQEAAAAFKRALELDPLLDPARLQLAIQLMDLLRANEAIPHLEYLQLQQPSDLRIPVYLAQCKEQMYKTSEAEAILDEVLTREPNFPPALTERAKLSMSAGQFADAEIYLRRAAKLTPGDYQATYLLYQCLIQSKKIAEADTIQSQLKQIEEDQTRMRVLVGTDLIRSPRDPNLHHEAGMIAMRAGNYREMMRWFEGALRIEAKHAPTHRSLAEFFQKAGQLGESQKHWEIAKAVDPEGTTTKPPIAIPKKN